MTITTSRVTITSRDGGRFGAYLALPGSGHGPGIVIMQEIFGVNEYMRQVAGWYAERGFAAICPDLFWRQEPGIELSDRSDTEWEKGRQLRRGLDEARAVEDTAAAMRTLRAHPACNGRVGGTGFCLGGKLAYLLSARFDPDCCVGYYGVELEKVLDEADRISTPLMLHIAGKDALCPPPARAAIQRGLGGRPLVTIHEYPAQDHAFARLGGRNYDAAAAELANLRSLEFFTRHLLGAGPGLPR